MITHLGRITQCRPLRGLRGFFSGAMILGIGLLSTAASAQSVRPYQLALATTDGHTDARFDVPIFSKNVFADQPQPPGRSIVWLRADTDPETLDELGIDWSRIIALYVDEPYLDLVKKTTSCTAPGIADRRTNLVNLANALRPLAPKTRFWVNFSDIEINRIRLGCSFNESYIDVVSMDFYYVNFSPRVADNYEYLRTHAPSDYQQLALVVPTFTGGTPPPSATGLLPQTATEGVSRLNEYLSYAASLNQTCHLPLGLTGVTGVYDGCPVWLVAGWIGGSVPPGDAPTVRPLDHDDTQAIFDEWQAKSAVQRIDPTQVRKVKTLIPSLMVR